MNGSIDVSTLVAYLGLAGSGGSLLVLVLTQLIKKYGGLNSGFVIHSMSFALGVAIAAAQYFIQVHGQLPIAIPGVSAVLIYGVAQFVFKNATYLQPLLSRVQINLAPAATPALAAASVVAPVLSQAAIEPVAVVASSEPSAADIAPVDPAANDFNA
jgi:hypothetical protein